MRHISLFLTVLLIAAAVPAARAEEETRIGKKIADFTLRDYHGKEVSLSDFADSKLLVVAFLGTDCPLVKLYAARLEEMSNKYAAMSHAVRFLSLWPDQLSKQNVLCVYPIRELISHGETEFPHRKSTPRQG